MESVAILTTVAAVMALTIGCVSHISKGYYLNSIKDKTVGNGQLGTARFAYKNEVAKTFKQIKFDVKKWRQGLNLPKVQGIVLGCDGDKPNAKAIVDTDDVHTLMIGAAGVGKTAYFLYPNLEYACASGMSFITSDTKGDLARNYGTIACDYYGYDVSVIDLRNPTKSDGNNMLYLVNKYMDIYLDEPNNLAARAKAEKYAKIISKTIVNGDSQNHGQNAYFYDSAEGLLTATILLVAECFSPKNSNYDGNEKRHIVSVFKIIQELLAPAEGKEKSDGKAKNAFQVLINKLPAEHKARWFAGSALNTTDSAMSSVFSTALSKLNAFLDSELEQVLCFDTAIDAEKFCNRKSAIFIILPEEDATKYFMVSLIVQQLYREILAVADENGGRLKNRVMMFLDEFGTIPKIESAEMMFSASRSRGVSIAAIIQSFAQLEKNYGKEGSQIVIDNCQDTIFGGFAPNSGSAEVLTKSLGTRTALSGTVSVGKRDGTKSLQMISRPLMFSDELKSMKKGSFIVTKTGVHPMKSKLKLYYKWGIKFGKPYETPEKSQRVVAYADKAEIERAIERKYVSKTENREYLFDEIRTESRLYDLKNKRHRRNDSLKEDV